MRLNHYVVVLLTSIVFLSFPLTAFSEKALIQNVSVKKANGIWKVGFSVENCFTEKMEEAIQTGIETIFTFYLQIYQKGNWLWDRKAGSFQFHHTLRYDPIRNEYQVTLGENGEALFIASLEEAKRRMARVDEVEIQLSSLIKHGVSIELRIKAELDPIRLPFHLEYLFFFVSLWDFETDWYVEPLPM
jgi:hypothetical protein